METKETARGTVFTSDLFRFFDWYPFGFSARDGAVAFSRASFVSADEVGTEKQRCTLIWFFSQFFLVPFQVFIRFALFTIRLIPGV